ncbi:DNA-binding protein [Paenibacillus faecis]|uniref:helix-turn-helix domain-containing protein n=1 Tax=Paenibacillus faecis TaxID=862114 RepID=UPI001B1DD363|nr:XRE family transcriptional regulator [Paenibacillus faecis]GIO88663.1 DNA-binding protein [Paenibacillus faecis]
MDAIHIRVGHNLQRIRKQRQLSLDKVAQLTGVSKGTLHQIERGETQPTVTTLWKIAVGLNITFSLLLKEEESRVHIVSRKEEPDAIEDNGRCKLYLLFPYDPQTRIETYKIMLSPGCDYVSLPHQDGVQEYITVVSGVFNLQIKEDIYTLHEGQGIRFSGELEHRYLNHTEEIVTIQVIMYYAET